VHFVGLTPSEPSSPAENKPTTTTNTNTITTTTATAAASAISATPLGQPASTDNGQLCHLHRHPHQYQETAAADAIRPGTQVAPTGGGVAAAVPAGGASVVGGTMRRTLYSPRYASDGQLKHYLVTTTNDVLSDTQY